MAYRGESREDDLMASIMMNNNPVTTVGQLPAIGTAAPAFELVNADLATVSSADMAGRRIILSIFPSIDTGVCAQSVREFNKRAAALDGTSVVCVSMDLPFALARFCGAEGIDGVTTTSGFRSTFGRDYGLTIADGPLAGLYSRAIVVVDEQGTVVYTEQVPDIAQEPDYEAALAAL